MSHGASLGIGPVLLQLRLFAGLDPSGIGTSGDAASAAPVSGGQIMSGNVPMSGAQIMPGSAEPVWFDIQGQPIPGFPGSVSPEGTDQEPMIPAGSAEHEPPVREPVIFESPAAPEPAGLDASTERTPSLPGTRKRRRDRWEADWSD